ncbi:MAG TPA: BON domain-containing protein [Clostridia bacterium]|nr:BON domain-containing protein [Clostridia bacterium]
MKASSGILLTVLACTIFVQADQPISESRTQESAASQSSQSGTMQQQGTTQAPQTQQPGAAQQPGAPQTPQQGGINLSSREQPNLSGSQARIGREVRHELVMLPYYSLFDNLQFRVLGDTVVLMGDVVRPSTKSEAENAVKKIEGVERVDNQINVLPLRPDDDRIRMAVARAIFSAGGLSRYSFEAVPSIHIVVNGGNVRLEGVVDNESDRNVAEISAKSVSGVFSVTNNLRVQSEH